MTGPGVHRISFERSALQGEIGVVIETQRQLAGDPCADRRLVKDPDGTKFAAQVFVAAEDTNGSTVPSGISFGALPYAP